MLTKAIIQSIDYTKNLCRVRIPLFENASRNVNIIEADAQFNIVPGIYNSYKTGDIVFIGFEENKMELPIIIGKLFVSASLEADSYRGNVSGNSLAITDTAKLPYNTLFDFDKIAQNNILYKDLNTPKKLADSILDLQRIQAQTQRYQTVITITAKDTEHNLDNEYKLYLKTSNDFTYSTNMSDELLFRLCTALKNSQTADILIPLDLAISKNGSISQALMQVLEITSTNIKIEITVDGHTYIINKEDINDIHSSAIYY